MKFDASVWLLGAGFVLVVAVALVLGAVALVKSTQRFGDEARVRALMTSRPRARRVVKGALLCLALGLGFLALAQPQYGRGTRLVPATNLDVVIALDYSKSMYARDVAPSRTARAKTEIARLVTELPGARFGAVAFAGEPMSFPITSDGPAIAQFFRQLAPNDMPVGGTAIARALEAARELLKRDPLSKEHEKVILLVTDGEDLEGDPVRVAQAAAAEQVAIWVVQIGGRTPEPIPEVDEGGEARGIRTDANGKPLTTSLTSAGEAQLGKIAELSGGKVVRAVHGDTGITEISTAFKRLIREELSEKIETVYADVYQYPLGLALLLLVIEAFVNDGPVRRPRPQRKPPRRRLRKGAREGALIGALLGVGVLVLAAACERKDPFIRNSPVVDQANHALDAGDASAASDLLGRYLSTGSCEQGQVGTPDTLHDKPNAGFDLGLALFAIGESFGQRFGEEIVHDGGPTPSEEAAQRDRESRVECALRVVRLLADDPALPIDLRARAAYLAGNLEFLRGDYKTAVKNYDQSLRLIPGLPEDAGDGIGRDAAFNRAIALARQEEQDRKKPDASPDASGDGPPPEGGDSGEPDPDGGQKQNPDGGQDQPDGGQNQRPDGGQDQQPDGGAPPPARDSGAPKEEPPPSVNQDDRVLDQLERAPTLQHHGAKQRGKPVTAEEDK